MKTDKKKVVFIGAILLIGAFILGYYFLVLQGEGSGSDPIKEVAVPELSGDGSPSFKTKKEAVDAFEDKRERLAPSVYDERLLDSLGHFDPDLIDSKKQRIVDSIYRTGRIDYPKAQTVTRVSEKRAPERKKRLDSVESDTDSIAHLKKMELEHRLFFAVSPTVNALTSGQQLRVAVDGRQTVKANDRLRLRCLEDGEIKGMPVTRNTILFGIVKFRPNRVVLKVFNIDHRPVELTAFDLADGLEGIYIRNSFKGDVVNEVLGEVIEDINIPGVPQVSGIQKVFQRNNRGVKVRVANNYELLLIAK